MAFLLVLFTLIAFLFSPAFAEESGFFSPERFRVKAGTLGRFSDEKGGSRGTIKEFFTLFEKALGELDRGDISEAETDLKTARSLWPEFYATDFLLALIYEKDRPELAARYYKSYLAKLKAYNEGKYIISAPLMRSLLGPDTEDHDWAYEAVRKRLKLEGIDLSKVREPLVLPQYVYITVPAVLLVIFLWVLFSGAASRMKRLYRVAHPPEGFWVCPSCGTENPAPNMVCQECGLPGKE
ncbi:MAG: hypothetical protein PHT95_00555 [Candidatus Omnitrophica bacterium]|nr:hypothetical protein [Candidatus Omnitrophota bacterium]